MDYQVGDALPELVKEPVTKVQLVKYAGASGDFNPIHYDEETARSRGLSGVIAHGMLSMAFLGQFAEGVFGPGSVRRLEVNFRGMVQLGEVITCRGKVTEAAAQDDKRIIVCEIEAVASDGEIVTNGSAEVWL